MYPVIPSLRSWSPGQEAPEFKVSLGYIPRPCLTKQHKFTKLLMIGIAILISQMCLNSRLWDPGACICRLQKLRDEGEVTVPWNVQSLRKLHPWAFVRCLRSFPSLGPGRVLEKRGVRRVELRMQLQGLSYDWVSCTTPTAWGDISLPPTQWRAKGSHITLETLLVTSHGYLSDLVTLLGLLEFKLTSLTSPRLLVLLKPYDLQHLTLSSTESFLSFHGAPQRS